MNWAMVLGAGLLAGATTCAATQGGLLMGLITRQRKALGLAVGGPRRLADDLAPVSGFLAGKLLSHAIAGFALGAVGALAGFDPRLGAMAQWVAGFIMLTLGLGALGVPGFRELQITPPDAWLNIIRKRTRSQAAVAPFVLGLAVIFVPCGVTISIAVLAATSGSPIVGAAVMALFVLGTAPMFTLFGYVSQRMPATRALNLAMGGVVVALGLTSINAGLVAAGAPFSVQALTGAAPAYAVVAQPSAGPTDSQGGAPQVIRIEATSTAYVPNEVTARAGSDISLVFATDNVWSCIRATMLPTLDKSAILPQTGEETIELGSLAPGDYPISCSMGMYTAVLHVV